MHSLGPLQLFLRRALFTTACGSIVLASACSDAKPRPQVALEPDASADAGPAPIVDAGADAACALSHSFGSASCNACIAQTCCVPLEACYADSACKTLVDCLIACLDTPDAGGCGRICEEAAPDRTLWSALESCVYFEAPCRDQCAVTR